MGSKICAVILKLCPRRTLGSRCIFQLDGSRSKKGVIQVSVHTIAEVFTLQRWILEYLSSWSRQTMGTETRNGEEFTSLLQGTLPEILSCPSPHIAKSCPSRVYETSYANPLISIPGLPPRLLHRPSPFAVLSSSSGWPQVWRWFLKLMIKGQYSDFPFKEFLFATVCIRNDTGLSSLKLKNWSTPLVQADFLLFVSLFFF